MLGTTHGGRKLGRGLEENLFAGLAADIRALPPSGWESTGNALAEAPPAGLERLDVLVTSASAELLDPSRDPTNALENLSRIVAERYEGRVVVLNASSVVATPSRGTDEGATNGRSDTEIRRLNLAIVEASSATGLSVLDADRIVAASAHPGKVLGRFDYAPAVCADLQSSLAAILGDLGVARRSLLELRAPYVRQADLAVDGWPMAEGSTVAAGDVLCELRVAGLRRMTRATNAIVLGAIHAHGPLAHRMAGGDRVRQRKEDRRMNAVMPLVAGQPGVLRKVLRPTGSRVRPGDPLAILTTDAESPIDDGHALRAVFRASVRTEDPEIQTLL